MPINFKHTFFTLMTVASLFILAACNEKVAESVTSQVKNDYAEATNALEQAKNPMKGSSNDTISISSGIWLGNESTTREHRDPLPKKLETPMGVTIATDEPQDLSELANQIYTLTGIPVEVDNLVEDSSLEEITVNYTGPLSGLLTTIGTDLSLRWYYDNGKIKFYDKETKTFTLYALATETNYSSTTGDGEKVSLQTTSTLKEWEEVENTLKSLVTDGEVSTSQSTGTITVTATHHTLDRVGKYIREQNRRLSKLVTINVRVLQVQIDNANTVGLNLTAMFTGDSGLKLASSTSNPYAALDNANQVSFAVADATGGLSNLNGTNAAINALAQQGQVSLVTSAVVTTRNNRIAPVNNTQTFQYVKGFETNPTSNDQSAQTLTVEKEEVGFNMQLLPNILENGRILLMFKMSLKELISLEQQSFGTADNPTVIQMPKIEERSFLQELVLKSGQTLIMTGFEKMSNRNDQYGIGDPDFMTLGGGKNTESKRDVLVVIITPQVLTSPLDPEERLSNRFGTPSY